MGSKNENEEGPSALGVPESSLTFQVSRSSEKHAQILSTTKGKPGGEVEARPSSCFPLDGVSSVDT
jgi:hypothetical protein